MRRSVPVMSKPAEKFDVVLVWLCTMVVLYIAASEHRKLVTRVETLEKGAKSAGPR